jgi:hypothetical protein
VKNGSQAANQRFFDFPEIKLIHRFQYYLSLIISLAKKILSRGEAIFQRSPAYVRRNDERCSATQHPDFLRSRQNMPPLTPIT